MGRYIINVSFRVESESGDPDYLGHLGHFFCGSSGSHSQTKFTGCNPDFNRSYVLKKKTLTSDKWADLGSGKYTEPSWCKTSLLPQAVLKHVVSRDFILKNSVHRTSSVSRKIPWHCFIRIWYIQCHFTLLLKRKL